MYYTIHNELTTSQSLKSKKCFMKVFKEKNRRNFKWTHHFKVVHCPIHYSLQTPENLYLRSHVPLLKYIECCQFYYFPRKHYCKTHCFKETTKKQSLEIQLYYVVIRIVRNFSEIFPFCKKLELTNTQVLLSFQQSIVCNI